MPEFCRNKQLIHLIYELDFSRIYLARTGLSLPSAFWLLPGPFGAQFKNTKGQWTVPTVKTICLVKVNRGILLGRLSLLQNIGSEHLVGLAGTGAKSGVGMAHWEMQGWMILILGWLFVPFYQLMNNKLGKIITMPDFLKKRYTPRTGSWAIYHYTYCLCAN